ncbi:MAG: lysophospholipid acyltransferase family protein [Candidatus Kapaibacteriales bacterium]
MVFDLILFPFRLLGICVITLIDSTIALICSVLIPRIYKKFQHYRGWAERILFIAGVKIKAIGLEKLEGNKSYVFVANHSSYFDIPAVFVAIPQQMRIMYKKELEKIPFFGWYLRASDFIPVEREDNSSARVSLLKAIKLIRENISVLLFPEGTRSPDGALQNFKRGAFLLALKSGKELVPLTIVGSHKLLPRGKVYFSSGFIKVIIGEPINVTSFRSRDLLDSLIVQIRDEILKNLKTYNC